MTADVIPFPERRIQIGALVTLPDGRLARVALAWTLPSGTVWVVAMAACGRIWEGEAGEVRVV